MLNFFQSFYTRLSLIFLFLISVIGASCILIAFYFSAHLFDEVEQLLNRDYARKIAREIQPLIANGFSPERIENAIHYMMVLNPMVEIYILDDQGKILIYFTHPGEKIVKDRINLTPVRLFIENNDNRFISGDDPRNIMKKKPFSADHLKMGTVSGYIYIILGGQAYEQSLAAIQSGYYARAALVTFLITILVTLMTGFLLFFLLTRRLRILYNAIMDFKQGEPFRPVNIEGKDELGALGSAFNEMAKSREESMEKLKQAEQMRKELIANISHDLRSPLASIMGYVETIIMKDEKISQEARHEYLEIILRNLTGMRKLVKELFEMVMLETKQIKANKELFDLRELVQDIVLKFKTRADVAQISLSVQVPPALPPVEADIGMIERIITNLLENGLRFTPPGHAITVRLRRENRAIEISVTDTGQGIEPGELPYIFDRYYQGKHRHGRSGENTGLGLAIARQMVELHGSTLCVESKPGEGTCFYFNLILSVLS